MDADEERRCCVCGLPCLIPHKARNMWVGGRLLWFHDASFADCYEQLRGAFLHREEILRLVKEARGC